MVIGNTSFLLTCILYFSNLSFIIVYAHLSAFAWSLLIFGHENFGDDDLATLEITSSIVQLEVHKVPIYLVM